MVRRVYERDLVGLVADYFRGEGYLVITEVWEGVCRADVVALMPDWGEVEARLTHGVPGLPLRTVRKLLRVLGEGRLSVKELASRLYLSESYVRKLVVSLAPLFVVRERVGRKVYVRRVRDYVPPFNEVISVEVKLSDWRSGFAQAYTYLFSSHKAYLAIYSRNARFIPQEVLDWATEKGIGLLTVSKTKGVREILPARKAGPESPTSYYILAESVWEFLRYQLRKMTSMK